ncbi:hypothetical protein N2152v2_000425 [Parachlorella kessleri]
MDETWGPADSTMHDVQLQAPQETLQSSNSNALEAGMISFAATATACALVASLIVITCICYIRPRRLRRAHQRALIMLRSMEAAEPHHRQWGLAGWRAAGEGDLVASNNGVPLGKPPIVVLQPGNLWDVAVVDPPEASPTAQLFTHTPPALCSMQSCAAAGAVPALEGRRLSLLGHGEPPPPTAAAAAAATATGVRTPLEDEVTSTTHQTAPDAGALLQPVCTRPPPEGGGPTGREASLSLQQLRPLQAGLQSDLYMQHRATVPRSRNVFPLYVVELQLEGLATVKSLPAGAKHPQPHRVGKGPAMDETWGPAHTMHDELSLLEQAPKENPRSSSSNALEAGMISFAVTVTACALVASLIVITCMCYIRPRRLRRAQQRALIMLRRMEAAEPHRLQWRLAGWRAAEGDVGALNYGVGPQPALLPPRKPPIVVLQPGNLWSVAVADLPEDSATAQRCTHTPPAMHSMRSDTASGAMPAPDGRHPSPSVAPPPTAFFLHVLELQPVGLATVGA